jgi:hypothetical protein
MTMEPPAVGVAEEPTVCVQINRVWMGYILGAVEKLASPGWWDTAGLDAESMVGEILGLLSTGNCEECPPMEYPRNLTIFAHAALVESGNAQSLYLFDGHFCEHIFCQTPSAVGDKRGWLLAAEAYMYKVKVVCVKTNWSGKVRWVLDDTETVHEVDLWNATNVLNHQYEFTIIIDPSGQHHLTAEIFGKHASSQGYDHCLTCFSLSPA